MQSLMLKEIGVLEVENTDPPEPCDGKVKVEITRCALCKTDAKMWERGHRDLVLPRILGHEFCGIRLDTRSRCVAWPGASCGKCGFCGHGYENLCTSMRISGFHEHGGLSQYALLPEKSLLDIPDGLSDDIACLAEPLACCINALELARVEKDQDLLIFGAGPLGLFMALGAMHRGARAWVSEINPAKLALGREFRESENIPTVDTFSGTVYDAAINAAPVMETFIEGIERLRSMGTFCIFSGLVPDTLTPDPRLFQALNNIHYRQLTVTGAYGCTRKQMQKALEILDEHKGNIDLLVSGHIRMEQVPEVLPKILAGEAMKYIVHI